MAQEFVGPDGRYDRAARRHADNALNNVTSAGLDVPGDDVSRAVYADPKARALKAAHDPEILDAKRALQPAPSDEQTATPHTKAKAATAKGSGGAKS